MPENSVEPSKAGQVNGEIPKLPRLEVTDSGSIATKVFSAISDLFNGENKEATGPPKPFVKSMDSTGGLTVGFNQKMVPADLDKLNKSQVAIRWLQD